MKKNKIFFLIIFPAMVGGIIFFLSDIKRENFIAYVNNEGISVQLFEQLLTRTRDSVYIELASKYGQVNQSGFWYKKIGKDVVPAEILKRKVLDECVRIKIQQLLARKKGIIKDISYSGFLKNLNTVNKERKKNVIERKVIYGPVEYTEAEYFDHLLSLVVIDLKECLANDEFRISNDAIKNYYEKNKNELYRRQDSTAAFRIYSYDEIKPLVRSNYLDYKYDQLIGNLIKTAEIKIDHTLYDNLRIN